jgi:CubicO group peptidase (beta-lactamase class C family)
MSDQEARRSGRLSREGLERFDQVAAAHVGDDEVPGLVALVARGDEVHVQARGTLAIGGRAVQRDSLFRISSTTKPVTGAATLALADEGLLRLDEPVEGLLPELATPRVLRAMEGPLEDTVPAARPITVRDLLTFTFGFGMVMEMFMAPEPWPVVRAESELHLSTLGPPNPAEQPDPDTWIRGLGSLPLLAQPGERWLYNTGASVLGVLLARAAGMPFAEVLRTRIFEPLGMRDTAFYVTDTSRLATAYWPSPGGLQIWDAPEGQWSRPPAFCDGAAGLVSTVDDLLEFARMLLRGGEGVLSPGAAREMTRDQLTPEQKSQAAKGFLNGRSWSFGQSVVVEGARAGAFGWDGGLGSSFLVDPKKDLTMVVLTQRTFENAQRSRVHHELEAAAYAAVA